jgi:hypothetical protein
LYIYQRLSLDVIGEKLNIGRNTLRSWKGAAARDGDDWDQVRFCSEACRDGRYARAVAERQKAGD